MSPRRAAVGKPFVKPANVSLCLTTQPSEVPLGTKYGQFVPFTFNARGGRARYANDGRRAENACMIVAAIANQVTASRATQSSLSRRRCALAWVVLLCASWTVAAATNSIQTNDPLCAIPGTNQFKQGPGTVRMIGRLQEILRTTDPRDTIFMNSDMLPLLERARVVLTNAQDQLEVRFRYAAQLLRAGRSADAMKEFDALPAFMKANQFRITPDQTIALMTERGMAALRLGEQENCLLNHNGDSCLFPIQGGGVHQLQRGAREAMATFDKVLEYNPTNLTARWLLNICCMTVGEYPDKVPPQMLIPPSAFASDYPLPRFPDGAAAAGIDVDDLAGGVVAEDFDGDGLLDILASSWNLRGQLRLFHNNGDGTFTERTREAGLWGLVGGLNMLQADYNNDGRPDVFILRGAWMGKAGHQPNSLLRNNGDGTFEDVTEEAHLLSFHPTQTAAWFDFDGDGWLDLFIGNESYGKEVHPCELYRNNGDGTFTECAAASGVAVQAFVKGVGCGDYDNDGRPDLYLSCRDQWNLLLHNDGAATNHAREHPAWRFTNVAKKAGVEEPLVSFPTWFFDYDNDGRLDIFVSGYSATVADVAADYLGRSNHGERARLYHNNGDGTFADVTRHIGLYKVLVAMGSNFGDLDNDGWLDFYLGTGDPEFTTLIPNRAFRNDGGTNFQDVTTAGGFGHLQKGHGIAFADFDNDGDQDIYSVMGGAYTGDNYRNALFVNPGNSNHWLTLKLEGTRSNRSAIGARIKVKVQTAGGPRAIYKSVCSGGSFGASPLRQEIGLGAARGIESVEIFWPVTGTTQTFSGLQMDRFYRVRENSDRAEVWNLKSFPLATNTVPGRHTMTHHQHPATGTP